MDVVTHAVDAGPARREAVPLRRRLLWVALAGILPLAIIAALCLAAIVRDQQREAERTSLDVARVAAAAVNVELQRSLAMLNLLGESRELDRFELSAYGERLQRLLPKLPGWLAIRLTAPDGEVLLTATPEDQPLPGLPVERESFLQLVRSGDPQISPLAQYADGHWIFYVRVPVMRKERLRYVLSAEISPDVILRVVSEQRLPESWTMSIFDAANRRVARSKRHVENLGGAPSPSLARLMSARRDEGTGLATTLEGEQGYTAYVRLPAFGWTVAVSVPTTQAELAAVRAFGAYGGGLVLSIVLAIAAALVAARRINRPMAELQAAARAIGAGAVPQPVASEIQEVREVGETLVAASAARRASEQERSRALVQLDRTRQELRQQLLKLQGLQEKMSESERQLREADRRKDEFLATLAHELRNPLAPIRSAVDVMQLKPATDPVLQQCRDVIGRQLEQLTRLVDDLLDVSRITRGKIRLELKPLEVSAIVERAIETQQPVLHARGQSLTVWLPQEPLRVHGDLTRLSEAVGNLLNNAAKYSDEGGAVSLRVERLSRDGTEQVAIRVQDSGAGIPPELLPRVFELFTQVDRTLHRAQGGIGVGLALVRKLAQMHGGSVEGYSEGIGKGAEFVLRLPLLSGEPPAEHSHERVTRIAPGQSRVLVVDDNRDAAQMLATMLRLIGAEVHIAHAGADALSLAERIRPALVLLDLGMPDLDGLEIARNLRARPWGAQTLLVAQTGWGREEDRARTRAAGFDAHLTKPVDRAQLLKLLERLRSQENPGSAASRRS